MGMFESEGAAAHDALIDALADHEKQKRQKMLDEIAAETREQEAARQYEIDQRARVTFAQQQADRAAKLKKDQDDAEQQRIVGGLAEARQASLNAARGGSDDPQAAQATRDAYNVLMRKNGAGQIADKNAADDLKMQTDAEKSRLVDQWANEDDGSLAKDKIAQTLEAKYGVKLPKPEAPKVQRVGGTLLQQQDDGSWKPVYQAPKDMSMKGGAKGAKADDADPGDISGDVADVMNGRNTLYNIRQTLGRSNKSAAYMQAMRRAIQHEDPDFDFVASDAGGKAVSSSYYQRGIAAVNAVLPNLDRIQQLSAQVPRLGITGVDTMLQKGAIQIGNKQVTSLHQARKLLSDEIGAALGAGSASDMKLQLGFDVTDPSVSDENFFANIGQVRDFLNNRKKGLESLRYASSTVKKGDDAHVEQWGRDANGRLVKQ